jgi:hypothetical protein
VKTARKTSTKTKPATARTSHSVPGLNRSFISFVVRQIELKPHKAFVMPGQKLRNYLGGYRFMYRLPLKPQRGGPM